MASRPTAGGPGHELATPGSIRLEAVDRRHVSGPRWAGVAVVLGALIMAAVLASGGPSDPGVALLPSGPAGPSGVASPTATLGVPDVAPVIQPPGALVTADRSLDAVITVPETSLPRRSLSVRVFRNGRKAGEERVRGSEVTVKDIGLRKGVNKLTAALVGPGGEGPHSAVVVVTLDVDGPKVVLTAPRDGQTFETDMITLRGSTEPGAEVTVRNESNGFEQRITVGKDGRFEREVPLDPGDNKITVRAVDALGNVAKAPPLEVTRGGSPGEARLTVSPVAVRLRQLPSTLDVVVTVRDQDGRPIDGLHVAFSLSPPGQSTRTFEADTEAGRAVWEVPLPREGAVAGAALVTAQVTLADGSLATRTRDVPFR